MGKCADASKGECELTTGEYPRIVLVQSERFTGKPEVSGSRVEMSMLPTNRPLRRLTCFSLLIFRVVPFVDANASSALKVATDVVVNREPCCPAVGTRRSQSYSYSKVTGYLPAGYRALKPALAIPRCASGFFMKVSHTKPVRKFSAISIVMPVSIPTTSLSYHFFSGLNASTKP